MQEKAWDEVEYHVVLFYFVYFLRIHLFLAALDFHCCTWAFCSCERRLLFVAVWGLLIAVAACGAIELGEASVVMVCRLSFLEVYEILPYRGSNPCTVLCRHS